MDKTAQATHAENELEVLFSDQEVTLGGRSFTVHEFSFSEQLKHYHLLLPLAKQLETLDYDNLHNEEVLTAVIDLFSLEYEKLIPLLATCTQQSIEWIKGLSPLDGENLIIYWFVVNKAFFVRRFQRKAELKMLKAQQITQTLAGVNCSPP